MANNRESITVTMRLRNAAKFAAEVRANRKEIQKFGKAAKKAGDDSVGLRVALGGLSTGLRLTALGLVVAAQGGVALAVGMVGLTSALGPLLGLVGALPAGLLLVAQAFGVVKLAGMGVGAALGPLSEAIDPDKFALLSTSAQDFVLALDAMKSSVRGLQRDLAGGLFPGVVAGLIAARPALDALHGPLVGTAHVLGAFARNLGQLVGSAGFLADLRSQASFNNVQLTRLGSAALHLVNVFRNLMVGSRGLVGWIVQGVESFAAWADRTTTAARATGGLERGFHTVQVTTQRVVLLFWRFGTALLNIGRIGKREVGDGLLVHLLRGATALERWTRSEAGIRKIGEAFAWSRRILGGVADFMHRAATGAGPELVVLLRNIVNALNPILSSGGGVVVLSLYANGLSMIAAAAGLLVRNVPGATFALSAFFAVIVLNKMTGALGWLIGGLRLLTVTTTGTTAAQAANMGVMMMLKTMYMAFAASTVGVRLGLIGVAISESAVGVAAGAMWTAITGPVGLAVLAIGAVVAAVVVLYNKWGWFRQAVQDAWEWIKTAWSNLGDILLAPFRPLLSMIQTIIGGVGKITGALGGVGKLIGKGAGAVRDILPFAAGGVVNSPLQLVGERGPELAAFPIGTRVVSAPETRQMLRAPTTPSVSGAARSGGGSGAPTIVRNYITLQLDKRVLTKVVNDVVADERAAG